jgi:general secretion pathway protein M
VKARWLELKKRWWDGRPAEDKRALTIAAWVLIPLAAWFVLWRPAHVATEKLRAEIPALRAQAEKVHAQSEEVTALNHAPKPALLDAAALKTAVEESAARHQLRSALSSIDVQQPDTVRITLISISFEQWLGWLRDLQREQHIRADSASIAALPQTGMVKINATLTNGGAP